MFGVSQIFWETCVDWPFFQYVVFSPVYLVFIGICMHGFIFRVFVVSCVVWSYVFLWLHVLFDLQCCVASSVVWSYVFLWLNVLFDLMCFCGFMCCLIFSVVWLHVFLDLHLMLCDQVCQSLAAGQWFSPVSSTNKTDRHDITEILLKVALNIIIQCNVPQICPWHINKINIWFGFIVLFFFAIVCNQLHRYQHYLTLSI